MKSHHAMGEIISIEFLNARVSRILTQKRKKSAKHNEKQVP